MGDKNLKKLLIPFVSLFTGAFLLLVFSPNTAQAFNDDDYTPLASIPGTYDTASSRTNLSTYLSGAFKVGIAVAGVLAFLMIVYGGFTYLSTDAITGKEEGKERIQRALGGLILAFASYIILNTINPSLVNLDLNFGKRADACYTASQVKENPSLKLCSGAGVPSDISYSEQLDYETKRLNLANEAALEGQRRQASIREIEALEKKLEEAEKTGNTQDQSLIKKELDKKTNEELARSVSNDTEIQYRLLSTALTRNRGLFNSFDPDFKEADDLKKNIDFLYTRTIDNLKANGDTENIKSLETKKIEQLINANSAIANTAIKLMKDGGTRSTSIFEAKKIMNSGLNEILTIKNNLSSAQSDYPQEKEKLLQMAETEINKIKQACKEKLIVKCE